MDYGERIVGMIGYEFLHKPISNADRHVVEISKTEQRLQQAICFSP